MELAEIAVESGVRGTFTYLVPPALRGQLVLGARVLVPFGRRTANGYYLGRREVADLARDGLELARLKAIYRRLDVPQPEAPSPGAPSRATLSPKGTGYTEPLATGAEPLAVHAPLLTPELLDLARWMARLYVCPLGQVLAAFLPAGVKRGMSSASERLVVGAQPAEALFAAAAAREKKAPKQAALLRALVTEDAPVPAAGLLAETGAPGSALQALATAGMVTFSARLAPSLAQAYAGKESPAATAAAARDAAALILTDAQREALDAIQEALNADEPHAFLLQGVTGSGKTEVYLRALETALARGRQGIVLVPEIALTPQTAYRFESRLSAHGVAVLHSSLTEGERAETWRAARAGRIGVVVGARSALFAPLPRLGCVIVDEEHETAFKQDSSPRYHAREAALERARQAGAVLVLGSATPSLESFLAARAGRVTLLTLPERVLGLPLPPVQVVDLREVNRETKRYNYLSPALESALRASLRRGEQAILFLNRRGFATVVTCPRCGHTERCEQCDITLTSHRARAKLVCHYCGREKAAPSVCSHCQQPGLKFWGLGTERVEQEVRLLLPDARVARMDSDTMTRREAYIETLSAFRQGQLDVLVGTQMIAKGLDFPNVTLVGIVLADTALHMPDFRSRERTFQLLEQVAGRAGRGPKGGRVLVQTHLPDDPAIRAAARHDYEGFAMAELEERYRYGYPPYTRLARVLVRSRDLPRAQAAAQRAGEVLRAETRGSDLQVLGPAPAPLAVLEGRQRLHLLVKSPDAASLAGLFAGPAGVELDKLRGVEVTVDVDPHAML